MPCIALNIKTDSISPVTHGLRCDSVGRQRVGEDREAALEPSLEVILLRILLMILERILLRILERILPRIHIQHLVGENARNTHNQQDCKACHPVK